MLVMPAMLLWMFAAAAQAGTQLPAGVDCLRDLSTLCHGAASHRECGVCRGVDRSGVPTLPPTACSRLDLQRFCAESGETNGH